MNIRLGYSVQRLLLFLLAGVFSCLLLRRLSHQFILWKRRSCQHTYQQIMQDVRHYQKLLLWKHISPSAKTCVQTQIDMILSRRVLRASAASCPFAVILLVVAILGNPMWGGLTSTIPFCVFFLLRIGATAPRAHAVIFLSKIAHQFLFVDGTADVDEIWANFLLRILLATFLPKSRSFFIANYVMLISETMLILYRADLTCMGTTQRELISTQLVRSVLSHIYCMMVERFDWDHVLALQSASSTSQRLLAGMSDAVVHLTKEMVISKGSPELATMLSIPCHENALLKTDFMEYVASHEQERFRMFIENITETAFLDELPVQALPVQLVDAQHMGIEVNCFILKHPGFEGTASYVLGISDTGARVHEISAQIHDAELEQSDTGQQPDDNTHWNPNDEPQRIPSSVWNKFRACHLPSAGEIQMSFSSWRVLVASQQDPIHHLVDVDLLQRQSLIERMLCAEGFKMLIQEFLKEIMGGFSALPQDDAHLLKFRISFSGVCTIPPMPDPDIPRPTVVVQRLHCVDFKDSEAKEDVIRCKEVSATAKMSM